MFQRLMEMCSRSPPRGLGTKTGPDTVTGEVHLQCVRFVTICGGPGLCQGQSHVLAEATEVKEIA